MNKGKQRSPIHRKSDSSTPHLTCESTRLSAREERLESEGSRSRRCALVRDPLLLPPSVVDLTDFKLAIVDAARASILKHPPIRFKPLYRTTVCLSCILDYARGSKKRFNVFFGGLFRRGTKKNNGFNLFFQGERASERERG